MLWSLKRLSVFNAEHVLRGSIRNDYGKQKFTGGDYMKDKSTFPPLAVGVVGAGMTIGGAVLMFQIDPFTIAAAVNPLLVFVSGMTLSSIAIVLKKKHATKKHEVENGKQK